MKTKAKQFFWWCSGANLSLLNKTTTEESKYVGIGATVFFTGIFAVLSGGYALYLVFDQFFLSVIFGMLWGLMIFNLDRYIVSSMRKDEHFFRSLKLALPRIVLAILISVVIAKPLELKFFDKEIGAELALMEQEKRSVQTDEIKNRYEEELAGIENRLQRLNQQIEVKTLTRDKLRKAAQMEADGTGGSMKVNAGPIYEIKKADAERVDNELTELTERNSLLIVQENQRLSAIQAEMDQAIYALPTVNLSGPAARLDALSRMGQKSVTIWWVNVFILLLFVVIETAPVIVKLIAPLGPYDHVLKLEEYVYEIKRAEEIGILTAAARERIATLSDLEKEYVESQLTRRMLKA